MFLKKMMALICVLLTILAIAGCGVDPNENPSDDPSSTSDDLNDESDPDDVDGDSDDESDPDEDGDPENPDDPDATKMYINGGRKRILTGTTAAAMPTEP